MNKNKVFWGILFILGAIALIANQLGYLQGVNFLSIVLAIFLVGTMIKSMYTLNFSGILFPLGFLYIIFDESLGLPSISSWTVLAAALLGSIGLSMIFTKRHKWCFNVMPFTKFNQRKDCDFIDLEDDNTITIDTHFGESIKYITSDVLESAQLSCHFGSMKVYFDQAKLKNGRALVRLDASFSGVQLYIPKTWTVEDRVSVSLGGMEQKGKNEGTSDNILVLTGDVSFSGVELIFI